MTSPPQYPQVPPQAAKKKSTLKIVLIVVGAIVGLCCIGGVVSFAAGGSKDDKTSTAPAAAGTAKADDKPAAKTKTNAKVGQPARDGQFEFVVTGVEYGKTKVGGQYANKAAQGEFALVSVKVTNIGKEPRMLTGANQTAHGPNSVKYNNDGGAEFYANEGSTATFLENINPGNSVQGVFVFDIPKGVKLTSIELHDSMLSGGVAVDLA